jgi:hypothetical protein
MNNFDALRAPRKSRAAAAAAAAAAAQSGKQTASVTVASVSSTAPRSGLSRPSLGGYRVDRAAEYAPLPAAFTGAKGLVMPPYLPQTASGVTLPSRLDLLGNQEYSILSVVESFQIGNAVVGFRFNALEWLAQAWAACRGARASLRPLRQLLLVPSIFSKPMARVLTSLRVLALGVFVLLVLFFGGAVQLNVGRAWMIGLGCSMTVMYALGTRRVAADGVMPFTRSVGAPEVEEMMFSYSWKVEEEAIRTLAKACWNSGVGVWIDVIKLCPGDEIRPVVRTMVRNVYKCVIFMSPEYCASPNCMVEFWEAVQQPHKLIICVLPSPAGARLHVDIRRYLRELADKGATMCDGLDELIPLLHEQIEDSTDADALQWWRAQKIASGGAVNHIVPTELWNIPTFQVFGKVLTPARSLAIGPVYIAGDCRSSGIQMRLPWLFLVSAFGLLVNCGDMWIKYKTENDQHSAVDFLWLIFIGLFNLSPYYAVSQLFETRVQCDAALRPLVASRAILRGVRVEVSGQSQCAIAASLRSFLDAIEHGISVEDEEEDAEAKLWAERLGADGDSVPPAPSSHHRMRLTVHVMNTLQERDALFGSDAFPFNPKTSFFIWSGVNADGTFLNPFTRDEIGSRMMRFLVLVADWEGDNLATSLFQAIGVRVGDVLHFSPDVVDDATVTMSRSMTKAGRRGSDDDCDETAELRREADMDARLRAIEQQADAMATPRALALSSDGGGGGGGGMARMMSKPRLLKPRSAANPTIVDLRDQYEPLPAGFTGAVDLVLPPYLTSTSSGATLPSRLEALGVHGWPLAASLFPSKIGNAVVGFDHDAVTACLWRVVARCVTPPKRRLHVLSAVVSRAVARMTVFIRSVLLAVLVLIALIFSNAITLNVGQVWIVGTGIAVFVLVAVSQRRVHADGVIPFCRSMGVPEVEEYMFSYSWKVEDEAIRTLAKACWNTGVGVWVDVVKLVPGDEIRPVVRSMMRNVFRCVVFMSPEYASSPNCCVEFWEAAQYPDKLVICVLPSPTGLVLDASIVEYLDVLCAKGAILCHGLDEVIPILHLQIEDSTDTRAFRWWQRQNITGGGVPDHVVPTDEWTIPRFQIAASPFVPPRSISVGPAYLAGDCTSQGYRMRLPWLFLLAAFALTANAADIFDKWANETHSRADFVWLSLILVCNAASFFMFGQLFETRIYCDAPLRPLLASRAIQGGVKVDVIGAANDPIAATLREFLRSLQHLHEGQSDATLVRADGTDESAQSRQLRQSMLLTVRVLTTIAERDALFGGIVEDSDEIGNGVSADADGGDLGEIQFNPKLTMVVWNGRDAATGKFIDPFTPDAIGTRMMKYLVLVAAWEGDNLADSVFSAIGMRVADVLHAANFDGGAGNGNIHVDVGGSATANLQDDLSGIAVDLVKPKLPMRSALGAAHIELVRNPCFVENGDLEENDNANQRADDTRLNVSAIAIDASADAASSDAGLRGPLPSILHSDILPPPSGRDSSAGSTAAGEAVFVDGRMSKRHSDLLAFWEAGSNSAAVAASSLPSQPLSSLPALQSVASATQEMALASALPSVSPRGLSLRARQQLSRAKSIAQQ